MRYALISGGKVANMVEWDGDTSKWRPPAGMTAVQYDGRLEIGWDWVDGAPVVPPPPAPVEPDLYAVSRLRLKLELAERGLLANVEAAVQAGGAVPQMYWSEATVFESNHPLVVAIGAAIGLDAAQVKALFKAASERDA